MRDIECRVVHQQHDAHQATCEGLHFGAKAGDQPASQQRCEDKGGYRRKGR